MKANVIATGFDIGPVPSLNVRRVQAVAERIAADIAITLGDWNEAVAFGEVVIVFEENDVAIARGTLKVDGNFDFGMIGGGGSGGNHDA